MLDRVKSAGLEVREEMDTSCCHANQDKFWVRDPDGVDWEVYHLNYDVDDEAAKPMKGLQMASRPALTKFRESISYLYVPESRQ